MKQIDNLLGLSPSFKRDHQKMSDQKQVSSPPHNDLSRLRGDNFSLNNFSLNNRTAVGMKLVFESISIRFSSASSIFKDFNLFEPGQTYTRDKGIEDQSFFDYEKVAENVMSFISSSVQAARQRGSSNDELEEMIEQARFGVNQGIDEAIVALGDLQLLDDDLAEGIEKSRVLIATGIDKLSDQLVTPENSPSASNQLSPISQTIEYASSSYAASSSNSDLSITTADGDRVTISFSALQERYAGEQYNYYSDADSTEFNYQSSISSYKEANFSFSVEGDLDDGEIEAISELIKDIKKIQKAFFNGNIEKAYEQALKLGFDDEQLNSFSLELQQTHMSYVSQTYNEIARYDDSDNGELAAYVKPIMDFVEQFRQVQQNAIELLAQDKQDQSKGEFNQLLELVLNAEYGNNELLLNEFTRFIEKLT